MENTLERIALCVEVGKINAKTPYPPAMKGEDGADELTQKALEQGYSPNDILTKGLIVGMNNIGVKFKENKVFVPQVLMSAKAMSGGMQHLKRYFNDGSVKRKGKLIIGTVKGDLHDIGKNLVAMMIESAGFEVIDLGVDVPAAKIIECYKENPDVKIIALSALLTTTMPALKETVEALNAADFRGNIKVMVGGAPITEEFAEEIGADGYSDDAASAASLAKKLAAA